MGTYINIGNAGFQSARNGEYVDKSGLIAVVNSTLFTERRFSCVTRCRRFGKSMAAKMLYAYYDQSCDSRSLFADLQIAHDLIFEKHLNKYPVIYLDMSDFVTRFKDDTIVRRMNEEMIEDIHKAYSDIPVEKDDDLMKYLIRVEETTQQPFIFIIDEWDAICREFASGTKAMDEYVDWLRRLFKSGKSSGVFACAYMTGILPIKKYKTESALNNFQEYSMVEPMDMAQFFGFTKTEVQSLAEKYGLDYGELEKWYGGYQISDELSLFNPNSVMMALWAGYCSNNWWGTSAIHKFDDVIIKNYDGIHVEVTKLFKGNRYYIGDIRINKNEWDEIGSKEDILTVLIYFGYLAYNMSSGECFVPNKETLGRLSSHVGSLSSCCSWASTMTAKPSSTLAG